MSTADNYKVRPSAPGSVLPAALQPPSLARHYSISLPPQAAAAKQPSSLWCPRHALVVFHGTPEVLAVFPVVTWPYMIVHGIVRELMWWRSPCTAALEWRPSRTSLKVPRPLQLCSAPTFDLLQKDSRNKKKKQEEK